MDPWGASRPGSRARRRDVKNHQNFDTIFQSTFFENGASRQPKWPPKSSKIFENVKSKRLLNIILA